MRMLEFLTKRSTFLLREQGLFLKRVVIQDSVEKESCLNSSTKMLIVFVFSEVLISITSQFWVQYLLIIQTFYSFLLSAVHITSSSMLQCVCFENEMCIINIGESIRQRKFEWEGEEKHVFFEN